MIKWEKKGGEPLFSRGRRNYIRRREGGGKTELKVSHERGKKAVQPDCSFQKRKKKKQDSQRDLDFMTAQTKKKDKG